MQHTEQKVWVLGFPLIHPDLNWSCSPSQTSSWVVQAEINEHQDVWTPIYSCIFILFHNRICIISLCAALGTHWCGKDAFRTPRISVYWNPEEILLPLLFLLILIGPTRVKIEVMGHCSWSSAKSLKNRWWEAFKQQTKYCNNMAGFIQQPSVENENYF